MNHKHTRFGNPCEFKSLGDCSSAPDLQLKKHGVHQLIVIGLTAHTCELSYEVTMMKDATADCSDEAMHAALDVNIPNYARAVVTTNEIVDLISFAQTLGTGAQ